MEKTVEAPKDGWGKIQREVLIHLKGNDFRVYSALSTYANTSGQCYPAVETLAKVTGITPRNIQKHLANLEQNGWIVKHLRTNNSTIYQLYYVKVSKPSKNLPKRRSKIDVAGTSEIDVGEVSKTDVLTDHLTDQYNIPIEQVGLVVNQGNQEDETTSYVCTPEERTQFDGLWNRFGVKGENHGSAFSAWKKYCSVGDDRLLRIIINTLDDTSGTYMTTQMKAAHAKYVKKQEHEEQERKVEERNKKHPLQQL